MLLNSYRKPDKEMEEKRMEAIRLFYSYAREDERLRQRLETHLGLLQHQGLISGWHDRNISAGASWEEEIHRHLDKAQIILLLVSSSFLHSPYCYSQEMKLALAKHEAGQACVIPVILRPVHWQDAPFSKLQALPTDARPITGRGWHNQEEAFANVAAGVSKVARELMTENRPISPSQLQSEHSLPLLTSHVLLVDASFDPHNSLYQEKDENGRRVIRYSESDN